MTSRWDKDGDPYGKYVPVRVFFNEETQEWACHCLLYQVEGKCPHLVRYRRTTELSISEDYL